MSIVSQSFPDPSVCTASKPAVRNAAFDRARTFITMLVLIHHSVIAYTYYGHTDRQSFLGFDGVVVFNDSFFMGAMFFLSGLFVWPSLQRKGVDWFLRDRLLRLGLPFAIAAIFLMPLAYYAIELHYHGTTSFAAFWWKTITVGPWPSGPAWFVWVLLALDVLAAVIFRYAGKLIEAIGRFSITGHQRAGLFFGVFAVISVIAYVPAVMYFGASRWFAAGPIAVQASRVAMYIVYFVVGVGIGSVRLDQGVLAADGKLAARWPLWLIATAVSFVALLILIFVRHTGLPDVEQPPIWWRVTYAVAFATYSAAQTLNILALFLRFDNKGSSIFDPLRDSAYGIFLVHYIPVLWMQYALTDIALAPAMQVTAILKAMIVFIVTLAVSWIATAALRRIPGATRVL